LELESLYLLPRLMIFPFSPGVRVSGLIQNSTDRSPVI